MLQSRLRLLILPLFLLLLCGLLNPAGIRGAGADAREVDEVVRKAAAFLKKNQAADGSFSARAFGPGVTAVILAGLTRNGYTADDPLVAQATGFLEKSVKPNGGIYDKRQANYVTSVAVMAFAELNKNGKYDPILKNASRFLKGIQIDSPDGKDVKTGGVGYDKGDRPDLSNTQFFVDALISAGVPKNDPAIQQALKFVSRCQNLPGETNDQAFARLTSKEDAGGLVYVPDPDDSKHRTPEGGLRSLGAMTYGGLKSFLHAGVKKDDPRVKAAINWIRRHYTLEENPGMGKSGIFYYYHTLAKAMSALGDDVLIDASDVKHDWRAELFAVLKNQQKSDGSFINPGDRSFGEADPNLATGFALLTLSYLKSPGRSSK